MRELQKQEPYLHVCLQGHIIVCLHIYIITKSFYHTKTSQPLSSLIIHTAHTLVGARYMYIHRPSSTVDNYSLYLPNFLTLFFPDLPGAHRAYQCLRLIRPHYYYIIIIIYMYTRNNVKGKTFRVFALTSISCEGSICPQFSGSSLSHFSYFINLQP